MGPPSLAITRIDTLAQYREVMRSWSKNHPSMPDHAGLAPNGTFLVPGYCWVDKKHVSFLMDDHYAMRGGNRVELNWRERMVCPLCRLNTRMRAAIHVIEARIALQTDAAMWLMEQVTPLYALMKSRYVNLVGSEFVSPELQSGLVGKDGLRHENATSPSFGDGTLRAVLSFDVLEHVPAYRIAFAEAARILAPGGTLLFSVPFMPLEAKTRARAIVRPDGNIEHLLPPQYHGDPIHADHGILCFNDFGWDMLDDLRAAGFRDACSLWLESVAYGYPNQPQMYFMATR